MKIGERVRLLREKSGMTQADLANLVDTDGNTVSRWERNKLGVRSENLKKLAAALNTSITYLLGETDEPGPAQSRHPVEESTPDEPVIDWPEDDDPLRVASMRLLKGMTPDQLRKAYEYLRDQKQLGEFLKEKGA